MVLSSSCEDCSNYKEIELIQRKRLKFDEMLVTPPVYGMKAALDLSLTWLCQKKVDMVIW